MMLKDIFVTLLCLWCLSSSGQTESTIYNNHLFTSEIGAIFKGSGDLLGVASGIEYSYRMNQSLALSSRFLLASAERYDFDGGFADSKALTVDLLLQITPLEHARWWSIGVGPSLRKLKSLEGGGYVEVLDEANTQTHGDPFATPRYINESAIGFSMIMNFRLFQIKNFQVGLQPYVQAFYTNGDISSGLSLNLGYQF